MFRDFDDILKSIEKNCLTDDEKKLIIDINEINEMEVTGENEDNFIDFIKKSEFFKFNEVMIRNCKIISDKDFFLELNNIRDTDFWDSDVLCSYLNKERKFKNDSDRYLYYHGLSEKFIYIGDSESTKKSIEKEKTI